jgi:hypothetical protein
MLLLTKKTHDYSFGAYLTKHGPALCASVALVKSTGGTFPHFKSSSYRPNSTCGVIGVDDKVHGELAEFRVTGRTRNGC